MQKENIVVDEEYLSYKKYLDSLYDFYRKIDEDSEKEKAKAEQDEKNKD